MSRIELTQKLYDELVAGVDGLPSLRPVAINANVLRAILRTLQPQRAGLPSGDDVSPDVPDDAPAPAPAPVNGGP